MLSRVVQCPGRWSSLVLAVGMIASGCATGDDGIMPRDPDAGVRMDAGGGGDVDAGMTVACEPPCRGTDVCRAGRCVPSGVDMDGDGVDASSDCDDANPSVGSSAERGCSSSCGEGVERCTGGVWETCTAPLTCDCVDGSAPRMLDCGMCGQQRQVCSGGAWVDDGACMGSGPCSPGDVDMGATCGNCGRQERHCGSDCQWGPWACVDEGECMAGATDTETRTCTPACGGTERRTRTCGSTCTWGPFGGFTGCVACGPVCGNGTCESGETCSSCADCRYGHGGTGDNGDSCAGVPDGTWRCVTRSSGGSVSQVCRNDATRCGSTNPCWISFNLSPRDCAGCVCTFSSACCQVGSTSGGC